MKKASIRPLLAVTAACLLPPALHAQTTLQSPGGVLGESAAQPAGQPMSTPMGQSMDIPMSPAASISQPFPPVSTNFDERDGLRFRALAGIERDDNVTRTSVGKISDTITSYGVGLRYSKRLSQQQFVVDAEVDRFDFDELGVDYNTVNYSAAWLWRFGNRLEGIARADRRQFRDVTTSGVIPVGTVNRRTERNELVEGGYRLGAAWRALAGLQHTATSSSDPNSWDGNLNMTSVRVGGAWEFASGSSITARYRRGEGDYDNSPVTSDFKDNEIEGLVRWVFSPKTTIDARLAHLEREHDGAPARDFDGLVGSLSATWDATAKTRVIVGYARDLGSYLFGASGHQSSDRWYITPVWRVTEATSVNLRYEHETRNWEDVTGSIDAGRRDRFNILAAGVEWQAFRSVSIGAQYRNERRSSSLPFFNYRANVIGLTAKLTI
ncbi:MAG: hypothetical protein AVDCRST_MAG51-2365 [uncultured Ramlibacter sp.]|uniref:Capsular polysaccharide synthesis enzyme CpsB n=1 Tax=uncultured Ramlibacter sp. TaxID=260755 RepID=A0A6J4PV48_9BURK|nr:MAG: hypothetical protein AVDCRST_MAG51-2365 [uncultured Ramlibacter sp.]